MSKFKDEWDGQAYTLSLDASEETDGDQASPIGWFGALTLHADTDGAGIVEHYGTRYLIVHESTEGFVTVMPFADAELRDRRFKDLQQAYGLWDVGISDVEIKQAIDNYLEAAVFTSKIVDPSVPWSGAAQVQARDEVIEFVLSQTEEIRDWQDATGHGWAQVGIDFSLTRNGHGAGFWSREGAGEVGRKLTEQASAWGEITVEIDDNGEQVFA